MDKVNRQLTKLHFSTHFYLDLVNWQLADAELTAPTFVFSDWVLDGPESNSATMTSPPNVFTARRVEYITGVTKWPYAIGWC